MCKDVKGYLDEARKSIEKKDYDNFMENICIAGYITKDDEKLMTEVLIQQSEGLYKFGNYKKALEVIEELLDSKAINDLEIKLELLRKKGVILGKRGSFEEAIHIFKRLVNVESLKFKTFGLGNLAWIYMQMYLKNKEKSNITKAMDFCKEAMVILENDKESKTYKEIITVLGNCYWYDGEYDEALGVFLKAYAIDNNDSNVLNNIATTYVRLREGELAEEYLDKAEKFAMKQNNSYVIANSNLIHGMLNEEVYDDTLKAKDFYLVAFDQFGQLNAYIEMCRCLDSIVDLDAKISKESISILANKIKEGLYKSWQ
ncbi:MAG: tetratricopeptide repeat protein [Halanaerobiales bacterium]|nr:tetratricopeptide repeat protein [Halanaerobiales bacterium]